MKKWAGFYLSEHTAIIAKEKKKRPPEQKEQMSWEEIDTILAKAYQEQYSVAIQKEELDSEGNYSEDIIGCIQGHDELGIYIADQKVGYDEIRHVQLN
ncbi:hypothetical protein RV18_GL000191 [Enterococcus termitis]|nr:hypothetical protein RV18_GL000191 [Enterococcus termitis]